MSWVPFRVSLRTARYDAKCRSLRLFRGVANRFTDPVTAKFLFVLCPAYCGSALMHEILCSSPFVSPNNIFGTREGESLPEVRQLIDYRARWTESYEYPWAEIKRVWMKYWDRGKPLLLDKSPPNLIRTKMITEHFSPVCFVAMVRDPYVHCEGYMRRDKLTSKQAAERTLQCLQHQRQNLEELKDIILIRYEDLVANPDEIKERLLHFLPVLHHVDVKKRFRAHNNSNEAYPITDMNIGKIENMTSSDVAIITDVLAPHERLLHYFGYTLHPAGGPCDQFARENVNRTS